jgi:hypothetical protein
MTSDTPSSVKKLAWLPAAIIATVMALLLSTVGTAAAQDAVVDDVADAERLRLSCAPQTIGHRDGVKCKWSASTQHHIRAYQLYRIVVGDARELIATIGPDDRLMHFDPRVSAPSTIIYGVVGLNRNGRVVAIGGPERVVLEKRVEELRFVCRRDSIEGERGILCRWSRSQQRETRGYLVYRSIDGAEREVIAHVGLDARRANFDTEIIPGAVHIYYVAAVDADGEVIGIGGPERVRWPRLTDRPTDIAPDHAID